MTGVLDIFAAGTANDPTAILLSGPHQRVDDEFVCDFSTIDRQFLDALNDKGEIPAEHKKRVLLPAGYDWKDPATGKPRVPAALCEFLAYKTALVYEEPDIVERNRGPATNFKFFDSSLKKFTDTQGCGFFQDGIAFIVMRGTQSRADWRVNLNDKFTDNLRKHDQAFVDRLVRKHGEGTAAVLGNLEQRPGRHLGFAIAWAAVHSDVVSWLQAFPEDVPVVLTGHSLGGALAVIGAAELAMIGRNVAGVVTFGAPLVGNEAFQREYQNMGLAARTARFEAQGDSVPRIMRRLYYRLGRGVQQRISLLVEPAATVNVSNKYQPAGSALLFAGQPMLTASDVAAAIRGILAERERAQRSMEERPKNFGTEKSKSSPASNQTDKSVPTSSPDAPVGKPAGHNTTTLTPSDAVFWAIIGFVVFMLVVVPLLLIVRSKLASHSVLDRYALFMSTLSYQWIRSLRANESGTLEERLSRADADLKKYLHFIRGDDGADGSYFGDKKFSKPVVRDLPVRIDPKLDLVTFLSEPGGRNII